MKSRSFVVLNVPEMEDKEQYLMDYLEVVLDQPLEQLQCLPQLPDRALFTLRQAMDVEKVALKISETPLEDSQLGIEVSVFRDAVIAEGEDLVEKVTPFFVKLYFQSEFGDSEETVCRCLAIADCEMILVCFEDSEDLADILKDPIHFPLPSVGYKMRVRQFCDNFHGLLPHGDKLLYQVVDGSEHESLDERGHPLDAAYHSKAMQSQDEESRGGQEIIVREIPGLDWKEKVAYDSPQPSEDPKSSPTHLAETKSSPTHLAETKSSPTHLAETKSSPTHLAEKHSFTRQSLPPSSVNHEEQKEVSFSLTPESSRMKDKIDDKMLGDWLDRKKNETADQRSNNPLRQPLSKNITHKHEFDQQSISDFPAGNRETGKAWKFDQQSISDFPAGNRETGKARKFDQQSISEFPAGNRETGKAWKFDQQSISEFPAGNRETGKAWKFDQQSISEFPASNRETGKAWKFDQQSISEFPAGNRETGKAWEFDQQSISDFPAGNVSSHNATLDNRVDPSESFYQHHTTAVSSGLWGQFSDKRRPPQSHTFSQMFDSENENGMPKLVQNKTAPRQINFPLRKSHWYLLKDSLRTMDLSTVYYDAPREVLVFESVNADECDSESIEDLAADVIESKEELSEGMLKVFKTSHFKEYFKSYVLNDLSDVRDIFVDIRDGFLLCCGLDEDKIDEVKEKVRTDLFSLDEVDNQSLFVEAIEELKQSLEIKYKVHIFWNEETAKKIRIIGVKQDVIAAKGQIQTTMDDNTTATKYFEFCGDTSDYILEHCQEELDDILKNVESCVDPAHDKFSIKYSGKMQDLKQVSSALDDIRISLKSEEIDVAKEFSKDEANLIMKELSLLSPDGFFQNAHDLFKAKHKCCILNALEEESDYQRSPSVAPSKLHKEVHSYKTCVSKKAIFILSPRTQLKIKDSGNIIRERSDVLVCVLDVSRQLSKTNVSKAFLSIEKDLQNTVDKISFSPNGVELVPFHSLKINCKAIVFVTLSAFEQGATEDCLQKAVLEVLIKAAKFKATSVSFPPLGFGRAMRYPEDVISEQFFSAVKEFMDNHTSQHQLRKIQLLACNKGLYYTLNTKGKTLFRKVIKNKDARQDKDETERTKMEDHAVHGDGNLAVMNANIRIIHRRQSEGLASRWKTELKNYVGHEEEIDTLLDSLPKSLDDKIKTKLKTIPVIITTRKSKSDRCVLKLKGSKDRVMQMKVYIAEEIVKEGKGYSQRSMSPSRAPRRGSVAFMKYLTAMDLSVPTYWKKKEGSDSSLHPVSDKTKQSIQKLLLATWNSAQVGAGRDAAGIPTNSKLELVSVHRVECPAAYRVYAAIRKGVLERKVRETKVCKSIDEISSSKQSVLTSVNLPDFMKQELCGEVNECYLFHGTRQETVDPIIKQGCQPSLTSSSAMFGKGVYAAESSTKADQYTDDPTSRLPSGSIHSMFLLRMLLGDVFRCTKKHPSITGKDSDKFVRPPCKKCYKDRCTCGDNFDSVMGDEGWIFREFVVYQSAHCYPEYLIKYKRLH